MSLDTAQDAFREEPGTQTGIAYANELIEYLGDNMIGNDTFRAGMLEITEKLTGGRNSLGWPVVVEVKAT